MLNAKLVTFRRVMAIGTTSELIYREKEKERKWRGRRLYRRLVALPCRRYRKAIAGLLGLVSPLPYLCSVRLPSCPWQSQLLILLKPELLPTFPGSVQTFVAKEGPVRLRPTSNTSEQVIC
jgi:hypothetical protein